MPDRATLMLDRGDELRVEVYPEDLDDKEIVVRSAADDNPPKLADRLAVIDWHLAAAKRRGYMSTRRRLAEWLLREPDAEPIRKTLAQHDSWWSNSFLLVDAASRGVSASSSTARELLSTLLTQRLDSSALNRAAELDPIDAQPRRDCMPTFVAGDPEPVRCLEGD